MESLFADLESKQAKSDLTTINATEWLEELTADHETFKEVYAQRVEAEAVKDIPTNETARKQLKPALENLLTMINAFYISGQIKGIEDTIVVLNETIERELAAARQSVRGESDADDEADVES